jgi:hypothetical protein
MAAERPTCKTCPYWDQNAIVEIIDPQWSYSVTSSAYPFGQKIAVTGVCKRHAITQGHRTSIDWCGEHPDFPAYLAALRADPAPPPRTDSTPSG